MKIIAFYLPQFHSIPENDEWWGKGFTEWTNMKKAEPLFEGHYQPKIPMGKKYYNLLQDSVKEWQVSIAKEYGVSGFCFYHYWFDGRMLLEKPMEQYLNDPKCDLSFCICWANEHWTKAWVSNQNTVLIAQKYGEKEQWIEHFNYLLRFFKDKRYICNNDKPLLVIYRPELIDCLNDMLDCWTELAIENGFKGIDFSYQYVNFDSIKNKDDSRFKFAIEYQPGYALRDMEKRPIKYLKNIKLKINLFLEKHFNYSIDISKLKGEQSSLEKYEYDNVWQAVLNRRPPTDKYIPGAFVDWDNSPRRGKKGKIFIGANPEKFEKYFEQQLVRARKVYKKDMLFIFAWNEWAEGGYLEPDEKYGYAYLNAIKNALIKTGEFPNQT
jgi:hypothetical protein